MHRSLSRSDLTVPALLIALSVVPGIGGVVRLTSIAHDTTVMTENARFLAAPAPVVIHIVSAMLYSLLGACQFSHGVRLRWPHVHRRAGVLLTFCGLLAGLTGLWMTVRYPIPTGMQGPILYVVRVLVASAMIASLGVAWSSILRRNIARHEAFMIRAYALGQGAGTQALVLLPWMLLSHQAQGLTRDLVMTLSWGLNVVIAESIIRARASRASRA